jgi:hypothetical protein
MVNSQVIKEISNAFKIDERVSPIPQALPVVEVGLKSTKTADIFAASTATNTASTTVYTTPTTGDFYLTFAALSIRCASVAAQSEIFRLTATINGATCHILQLVNLANLGNLACTSTEFRGEQRPIKIDKGTNIIMTMNAPTSSDRMGAVIHGFVDEVN